MTDVVPGLAVGGRATGAARTAAFMSVCAAALYALGVFVPYVTGGGDSGSLSDGTGEVHFVLTVPAILAGVLAIMGLQGRRLATAVAAGLVLGMVGFTTFILVFVYKIVDSFTNYDYYGGFRASSYSASYGVGFWAHVIAACLAVVALFAALSAGGTRHHEEPPQSLLCVLGGLAFIGMPLAILLPDHGVSVFDIGDGALEFSIVLWAVLGPLVGLFAALSRRRAMVALALGVALANLGLVLAIAQADDGNGSSYFPTLNVTREGLFNISVVASVVLVGLALLMANSGASAPAPLLAGSAGAATTPPQWSGDPFGRHQVRFWDGLQWTSTVADNGVVGTDPAVATPPPPVAAAAPPVTFAPPTPPVPTASRAAPATAPDAEAAVAAERRCPQGHPNSAVSSFCTTCGQPLGA